MKKQQNDVIAEVKEAKKDKSYSKEALLKVPYLQEHFLVASVVLSSDRKYTINEATELVRNYLNSEVGTC